MSKGVCCLFAKYVQVGKCSSILQSCLNHGGLSMYAYYTFISRYEYCAFGIYVIFNICIF